MIRNAVLLYTCSGVAVLAASFLGKGQMALSSQPAKWFGIGLVAVGMVIMALAALSAGAAFQGGVEPVLDILVTSGLYRLVRHPVYLGTTVALAGVTLAARSYVGLACLLLVFLPAAVHRARREERALSERFVDTWHQYAERTAFMIPGIW